jgi:hypothetical protein
MKINSLKLTLQDVESSDKKKIAVIFGTVFIDNDKYKEDINGPVLDEHGEKIPVYETINFTTALDNIEHFKQIAQEIIIEALTLKNMKIAEKNGELSHFIESVGGDLPKAPRGFRKTMSDTKYLKTKAPKSTTAPRKKKK